MKLAPHLLIYCDHPSYLAGDPVDCHVATSSGKISISVFRSGRTETLLWSSAVEIPTAPVGDDRVIAEGCNWPVGFRIPTERDWPSGGYITRIADSEAPQLSCEGFFVLRPAERRADMLVIVSTSTYQAYNDFGGGNTYAKGDASYSGGYPVVSWRRPLPAGFVTKPADFVRIANVDSRDESIPYLTWAVANGLTIWGGGTGWSNYELPFVAWAEGQEYDLDYATSHDLHRNPDLLDGYRLVLSVGHDEYWSWEMRDNLESFITKGGNDCFFSGNTAFWQVRFDDDLTMTAYKAKWRDDPAMQSDQPQRTTGLWSNRVTGRPENEMTGVSFTAGGYARVAGASPAGSGGFTVYRPEHWALAGTGLRYGDVVGADCSLAGYEIDGYRFSMVQSRPQATGSDGTPADFEILALAPAQLLTSDLAPNFYPPGSMSDFDVVVDQCANPESGGTVFTAGTTEWACGLGYGDPVLTTITSNLLARLGSANPS